MEKYIKSIKDLVIDSMNNDSQIQYKANVGKPDGCFKKGLIHLLGINTPLDFKKAIQFFSHQSLADNPEAQRLRGFIAECEGNFSQAFQHYGDSEKNENDSYLERVIKGRNHLQQYLKKLELPTSFNKELSTILNDYSKGKASKVGATIKIAAICNDAPSCLEAARSLYDSQDYLSSIEWLKKGNIGLDNPLFVAINETIDKTEKTLLFSKELKIVDLNENKLLSHEDLTPFLNKVRKTCEEASMKSSIEWKEKNKKNINTIIKAESKRRERERFEEEAEEEARRKKRMALIWAAVFAVLGFFLGIMAEGTFIAGVKGAIGVLFWYYVIKWFINRKKK